MPDSVGVAIIAVILVCATAYFAIKVITFDVPEPTPFKGSVVQSDVFAKSTAVAKEYWASRGRPVTCGKIGGLVLVRVPALSKNTPDAGARKGVCQVLYRRGWYRTAIRDPQRFCTLTVHEIGHIIGLDHSPDPNDIMHDPALRLLRACSVLATR